MDNYINLAELRKTAEAILVKMQDKLDEKANIDDFILEEGYDDDYNYKIKLTNDKSFIIPWSWVASISQDQIGIALSGITSFEVSVVSTLPATGNSNTFYFLSKTGTTGDVYDEYMYINNQWEKIGTTAIDLSNYLQTTDVADWAKASTKPSYTASEVGAAASSHTHGNITNSGDITTTATIASGDRLIINDESASKLTNSSITFGTSTSQYLANNGTWQAVPTTLPASDVSAWAKAATKPTYTAAEVGALPDTTVIPNVPSWALAETKPTYTASEVGALPIQNTNLTLTCSSQTISSLYFRNSDVSGQYTQILVNTKTNTISITNQYMNTYPITGATKIIGVSAPTEDNGVANKKYVDDKFASITIPTNISAFTNDSGYLTSYTETDPVFAASAAAGITATDISNWNAKVSDDKTWNGVSLIQTMTLTNARQYIMVLDKQKVDSTMTAGLLALTSAPTAEYAAKYDENAYLNSTTPAATDNSTKVATTAYVKTAISNSATSVTQTLTSGTAIAEINGVTIYAPSYTDADGVSY